MDNRSMNTGNKIGTRRSVHVHAPPGGRSSLQLGHEEAAPVVWDEVPARGEDYIAQRTQHARMSCPFGVNQGVQHKNRAAIQAAADDRLRAAPFVTDSHRGEDASHLSSQRQHFRGQRGQDNATPWGTSADLKKAPATPSRRGGGYGESGRRPDTAGLLTWEEAEVRGRPSSSAGSRYAPGRGALQHSCW